MIDSEVVEGVKFPDSLPIDQWVKLMHAFGESGLAWVEMPRGQLAIILSGLKGYISHEKFLEIKKIAFSSAKYKGKLIPHNLFDDDKFMIFELVAEICMVNFCQLKHRETF
jgi:hypothetical protein